MRACVTRDGAICAKDSTFDYFVGTNPITQEGIQLQCPAPIMAPVFTFFFFWRIYAPINVKPAGGGGGGRAWGGDLIVFLGPRVGHLTDLVLPGEGIFESSFARRGDI